MHFVSSALVLFVRYLFVICFSALLFSACIEDSPFVLWLCYAMPYHLYTPMLYAAHTLRMCICVCAIPGALWCWCSIRVSKVGSPLSLNVHVFVHSTINTPKSATFTLHFRMFCPTFSYYLLLFRIFYIIMDFTLYLCSNKHKSIN